MVVEKFKVNRDFSWRFNNIKVGTIKEGTIITVLDKRNNQVLLSHDVGWVASSSPIWKVLTVI